MTAEILDASGATPYVSPVTMGAMQRRERVANGLWKRAVVLSPVLLCVTSASGQTANLVERRIELSRRHEVVVEASPHARLLVAASNAIYVVDGQMDRIERISATGDRKSWKVSAMRGQPSTDLLFAGVNGDSLWTWSPSNEMTVVSDSTGNVIGRRSWRMPPVRVTGNVFVPLSAPLLGYGVVIEAASALSLPEVDAIGRLVLRSDGASGRVDTLMTLRSAASTVQLEGLDGRLVTAQQPWVAVDLFAFSSESGCAAAVIQNDPGFQRRESVEIWQWCGIPNVATWSRRALRVQPDRVDPAVITRFASSLEKALSPDGGAKSEVVQRTIGEALTRSTWMAPIQNIVLSSTGSVPSLWLQDGRDISGQTWRIIQQGSEEESVVKFPEAYQLLRIERGRVWATQRMSTTRVRVAVFGWDVDSPDCRNPTR